MNVTDDNKLLNDDLAPTSPGQRTWRWYHFCALWIGMVVSIPAYLLASGLIEQGMSPMQAIVTILLGNMIVLVPMLLIGHAGTRYGIPYAVLVRSAFGTTGALVAAMARALVACGWFGIQTWVGGSTLLALASLLTGWGEGGDKLPMLGITMPQFIAFLAFWIIQLAFVSKGMEMVRKLETWTAPFKVLVCLALLGWAIHHSGGIAPLFEAGEAASDPDAFHRIFWPSLTAMVGFWATLALNIPDFTRFAKTQKDQIVGQAIGLPAPMAMLAIVAVMATAATRIVYGKAIWDPVELATNMDNFAVLIGLLIISVDTVSCNIAANLVGPAYDFAALSPRHISYRRGAMITAVIGLIILPWKLIESSNGYIFTWLVGYSALLGPIAGIMIADYWIVRRGLLDVPALFDENGIYRYSDGWNVKAMIALAIGVAPNVPGFLANAFPETFGGIPAVFQATYPYAWFVGAVISGGFHVLFMTARRRAAPLAA